MKRINLVKRMIREAMLREETWVQNATKFEIPPNWNKQKINPILTVLSKANDILNIEYDYVDEDKNNKILYINWDDFVHAYKNSSDINGGMIKNMEFVIHELKPLKHEKITQKVRRRF